MRLSSKSGLTFCLAAAAGSASFRALIETGDGSLTEGAYFWIFLVGASAGLGGTYGSAILNRKETGSLYEAAWRSMLVLSGGVMSAVILAMFSEGIQILLRGDPVGAALKVLMVVPFGPITGLLAVIFSSWILGPLAFACAVLLYPSEPAPRQKKIR